MNARAVDANKNAIGDAGPCWILSSTVEAALKLHSVQLLVHAVFLTPYKRI